MTNGITGVALTRLGDPKVIPLWFGEGDLVTPEFIRAAAKQALDEGYTFYSNPRGRPELRAAIVAYLARLYGVEVDVERVTVPGSSMLAITRTLLPQRLQLSMSMRNTRLSRLIGLECRAPVLE